MAYTVAAVIPVYNGAALIRRAIDSVLRQTRPVDELIVVDDGSTDETAWIVQSYGAPVRYLHQSNQGVSAARNHGIERAGCPWVAFLDHDDEWLPERVERHMAALEASPRASLCYSAYWCYDWAGHKHIRHLPLQGLHQKMRLQNPFPPSVVTVNREKVLALGGFNRKLTGAEDWDLFIRVILNHEVTVVDQPLTNHYESPTSASWNGPMMLANSLSIVEPALLTGLSGLERAVWRRRIKCVLYYSAAITAKDMGQPSLGHLLHSLWQWPIPDLKPQRWLSLASYFRPRRRASRT